MTPRHTPRNPTSPQDWLAHAASDLALAKLGVNSEVLPEQIFAWVQQNIAEK